MENLEEILKKVSVRVSNSRPVFDWKISNTKVFQSKAFRIKFLKISCLVLLTVPILWFFVGRSGDQALKIQSINSVKSNNETVNKVAQLIVLPEESPIIAIVSKVELLENNIFFNGAKNGDKVLLFEKAGKAILYDSVVNRILNVGSVAETGIKL